MKNSKPQRIKESVVKDALKALNCDKLISHLRSAKITPEAVDQLTSIMRKGGLPIFKHPSPKAEEKRRDLVSKLKDYIGSHLSTDETQKIELLVQLIEDIEVGYRKIISISNASAGASLPPPHRVSALLKAGTRHSENHLELLSDSLTGKGPIGMNGTYLPGVREGERHDPDVFIDSITQSVSMSLLMEGYRSNLFNSDGILVLPELVPVEESEIESVEPILNYATSWRFWEYIEEETRYFGGNLRRLSDENIQEDAQAQGISEIWLHSPASLDWSRLDSAANSRLSQQLQQNYYEMERAKFLPKASGIEQASNLPPSHYISMDEIHSIWALEQTLSINPITHKRQYSGLSMLEWLRGYSVLKEICINIKDIGGREKLASPILHRRELKSTLCRAGLTSEAAQRFVSHASLCRSSRDLFDTPLIALEGDLILIYRPALAVAIPAQVVLSRLSSLKETFEIRGKSFERSMMDLMKSQGLRAVSVKEKINKEEYDYDLLVRWDPYVFLFECKSRSLSSGNCVRSFRFLEEVHSQVKQVERLIGGIKANPDLLDRHLGAGASDLLLIPCVLNALPFSIGEFEGVFFTDASSLSRLFKSAAFETVVLLPNEEALTFPTYRIWAGDKVTPEDLLRQIQNPPQLRMKLAEGREKECWAPLAPGVIAGTRRIVRYPLDHGELIDALRTSEAH